MEEGNAQKEVLVSLADCCTVLQGKNVDKKKTNEEAQGLPVIVGASDLVCGALSPKRWCSQPLSNPVYSEKGDILVSVVGTIGKMAVNTVGRAILSKHVCALRIREGISRQYLMAMVSRLILDAIPDPDGEAVLGFQNKADVEMLKQIRFTLPPLIIQEWIVARLTSVTSMILAYKGKKEDYLSYTRIVELIEEERKEQRAHMRRMSEQLGRLADMLDNLPPDADTLQMIADARSAYSRLLKIQ